MNESDSQSLQYLCDELIRCQDSLFIASRSKAGQADISYAPYVRIENLFYIFVSELAKHTQNMLSYPHASILFIEPEADAANPFARKRLTFNCQVIEIVNTEQNFAVILNALKEKFGEIVDLLSGLPDFHLLALKPVQGQFVAGFGKAFPVDEKGDLSVQAKN